MADMSEDVETLKAVLAEAKMIAVMWTKLGETMDVIYRSAQIHWPRGGNGPTRGVRVYAVYCIRL